MHGFSFSNEMADHKFGIWNFGAKNYGRVELFAQNFMKCKSDPTNPWEILHGLDQNSYKKPFEALDKEEVVEDVVHPHESTEQQPTNAADVNINTCVNSTLEQWPQLLPSLSEDDACTLLQDLCEKFTVVSERHALVATHLLLPRLQSEGAVSRKFAFSAMKFVGSFPAPSIRSLLTDLIVQAPAHDHHLDHVKELVGQLATPALQATLLSSVTSSLEHIQKSHVPFLLLLVGEATAAETTDKLVELMAASAVELANEITFGRLIIAVVTLESANHSTLGYIVSKHQTPLKAKAAKMLGQMAAKTSE